VGDIPQKPRPETKLTAIIGDQLDAAGGISRATAGRDAVDDRRTGRRISRSNQTGSRRCLRPYTTDHHKLQRTRGTRIQQARHEQLLRVAMCPGHVSMLPGSTHQQADQDNLGREDQKSRPCAAWDAALRSNETTRTGIEIAHGNSKNGLSGQTKPLSSAREDENIDAQCERRKWGARAQAALPGSTRTAGTPSVLPTWAP